MEIMKTAKYLKYLAKNLNISDLTTFKLVKLVYMIQEFGLFLGYRFGWFIYDPTNFQGPFTIGPSSSQLLYYEDEIRESYENVEEFSTLSNEEKNVLDKIVDTINLVKTETGLTDDYLDYILELVTSLHFAIKYVHMPGGDKDKIVRLHEVKPELDMKHLEKVYEIFQSAGIL